MKSFLALALSLAVGFSVSQAADKEKLVGVWEPISQQAPKGAQLEFTADGKVIISVEKDGKNIRREAGIYKLEGDKLTLIGKTPNGKDDIETDTIKSLSEERLLLIDDKGKENEFKRVKK